MRLGRRSSITGIGFLLGGAVIAAAEAPKQVSGVKAWVNVQPRQGERGPDWDREMKGGVDFARLRGKVVVLEFWATWCPPCRESIPHLNEMHRAHGGEVVVLGLTAIDRNQSEEQIRTFVQQNIRYPVGILEDDAVYQRYDVSGIPHAVVVGRDGQVVWTGNPHDPGFRRAVERAAAPAAQPTSRPSRR
ncbi:MAG: TlpA family protein disulfide reductase [Planctomycetes bacterium]|nr:TlpA family protein disulfide reductase [Planctomycetota bacterium]